MGKSMSGFRGSLDLYYQLYDSAGATGQVFPVGNVTDFQLIPDAEELEIISTSNDAYGQAADSMIDAKPTKCSFGVNRFDLDTLALAWMGEIEAQTIAEKSETDKVVAVVKGGLVDLGALDISALVIKGSAGTPTFELDTDYRVVDAALGLVEILDDGAIVTGDVKVSYTAAAQSDWLIKGAVNSSKFVRLFGRGLNRFNNKRSIVNIPRGSIKPSGNFSLVGSEAATVQMDVTITVPTDGSAPFTVVAKG